MMQWLSYSGTTHIHTNREIISTDPQTMYLNYFLLWIHTFWAKQSTKQSSAS